jgi:hypothetical protein
LAAKLAKKGQTAKPFPYFFPKRTINFVIWHKYDYLCRGIED